MATLSALPVLLLVLAAPAAAQLGPPIFELASIDAASLKEGPVEVQVQWTYTYPSPAYHALAGAQRTTQILWDPVKCDDEAVVVEGSLQQQLDLPAPPSNRVEGVTVFRVSSNSTQPAHVAVCDFIARADRAGAIPTSYPAVAQAAFSTGVDPASELIVPQQPAAVPGPSPLVLLAFVLAAVLLVRRK